MARKFQAPGRTLAEEKKLAREYAMATGTAVSVPGVPNLYFRSQGFECRWVENGKEKTKQLAATGERDAVKEMRAHLLQPSSNRAGDPNVRCDDLWEKSLRLRVRAGKLTENTAASYDSVWRLHGQPLLGRKRVVEVSWEDVEAVLDRMRSLGYRHPNSTERREYSESALYNAYGALSSFFKSLTKAPLFVRPDNPAEQLGELLRPKAPNVGPVRAEDLVTNEEVATITGHMVSEQKTAQPARAVETAVEFGLRRNELLALTWDRVIFDGENGAEILVDRQIRRKGFSADRPETWFSPLKGEADTEGHKARYVPMSDRARAVLLEQRKWWFANGGASVPHGLVFFSTGKAPIGCTAFSAYVTRYSQEAIGRKVKLHWLRHTFASNCFAAGHSMDEVSAWLGHTETAVTRKRYVRLSDRSKRNEAFRAARAI